MITVVNQFDNDKLRKIRKTRKETLKSVSEATGVSVSYLSEIERGDTPPSIETLIKLCDYYKVEAAEMFCIFIERGDR